VSTYYRGECVAYEYGNHAKERWIFSVLRRQGHYGANNCFVSDFLVNFAEPAVEGDILRVFELKNRVSSDPHG
jgi:hypothetical protein